MNQALKLNLFIVFLEVVVIAVPATFAKWLGLPTVDFFIAVTVASLLASVTGLYFVHYTVERELGNARVLDLTVQEGDIEWAHRLYIYEILSTEKVNDSEVRDWLHRVSEEWHSVVVLTDEGSKLLLTRRPFEEEFIFRERFVEAGLWGKRAPVATGSAVVLGRDGAVDVLFVTDSASQRRDVAMKMMRLLEGTSEVEAQ